ncbi:MAG TPA: MFS transporter [Anaerolineae bacterium]
MSTLTRVRERFSQYNNLTVLSVDAFVGGLQSSVMGTIWQPFVLSLGASMSELGLLGSIGGPGGFLPTLIQPVGGWLADRGGRKPLIVISLGLVALRFVFCLLAGLTFAPIFLALSVISAGFAFLDSPATQALTAESVHENNRGSAFSILAIARMLPGILLPTLAGIIADRAGFNPLFGFLIVVQLLAIALVARLLRETGRKSERWNWKEARSFVLRSFTPPRHVRAFFFALAVDSFSWGLGWGLLYGMVTQTYHFTTAQIGVALSIMSLTWALVQLPIGRYIDRHGTRLILIVSEGLGPPVLLAWILSSSFEVFAAAHVLFALTAATWVPAVSTYLAKHVDGSERAETFGRLSAFRGLIGFPAPFLGGLLFDHFGIQVPLLANLVGSVLTLTILILFVHERPITGAREA